MYPIIFNIVGQVSIGTIYRWHKQIKTKDDYTPLIPNYDYGEKRMQRQFNKRRRNILLNPYYYPQIKLISEKLQN